MLFGYGERPFRVTGAWLLSVLLGAAIIHGFGEIEPSGFENALYFSAASFAALGYGSWLTNADLLARAIGVLETFWGVFLLALFVTTFVRRYTR
jgi:hypothetical protein